MHIDQCYFSNCISNAPKPLIYIVKVLACILNPFWLYQTTPTVYTNLPRRSGPVPDPPDEILTAGAGV